MALAIEQKRGCRKSEVIHLAAPFLIVQNQEVFIPQSRQMQFQTLNFVDNSNSAHANAGSELFLNLFLFFYADSGSGKRDCPIRLLWIL